MSEKKRILYVVMSGINTPQRLYAPFILASTAVSMDVEATVYFVIEGVSVIKEGEAEKIQLGSFPSLREVMDQALAMGVRFMVCEQSCMLLGLDKGDFIPASEIVGAATLNDLMLESDAVLSF
jgi:predicted peroxiredoxin